MHNIIIIAAEPWEHYTWRRRHHVAWNLAKKNRVLFVEPPLTLFNPFFDINLSWKHLLNLGRLKRQGHNLYSYSPWRRYPLSLPLSSIFDYKKINQDDAIKGVVKVVKRLGFKNPILWIYYHPYHYDYYGIFNEKIVVTDWYDKFTAPAGIDIPKDAMDKIRDREDRILKRADIVFAVSKKLADDLRAKNGNVYVIPQGVDVDSFTNITDRDKKSAAKRLGRIKRPLLGFLGIMHSKVDFNLLNYIAEEKPDWSILLMGKEWLWNNADIESYRKLRCRKNVFYTGELKKESIPAYLTHMDVCLLPLKNTEFNRFSNPLKLCQYLAAGKPIVAVDLGIKYDFHEFIKITYDKDEFIMKIEECLNEACDEGLSTRRKEVAGDNSWGKRVESMLEIINKKIEYA